MAFGFRHVDSANYDCEQRAATEEEISAVAGVREEDWGGKCYEPICELDVGVSGWYGRLEWEGGGGR
jgi:hypothetical protein